MWQNLQFPVDLATFTEEIFNGKLHILCSELLHRLWLKKIKVESSTLRRNCPYLDLFWSLLSRIQIEYGEVLCISPYSVRIRENTDQNNVEYGHAVLLKIVLQNSYPATRLKQVDRSLHELIFEYIFMLSAKNELKMSLCKCIFKNFDYISRRATLRKSFFVMRLFLWKSSQ